MKKEDLIKYALIAGGAYLAYMYLKNSGLWDQWFGVAPAVAPQPAAGTPVLVVDNSAKIAADAKAISDAAAAESAHTAATVDERILERLAADADYAKGSTTNRLTWDEWNWYLAKWDSPTSTARTGPIVAHQMYASEEVGLSRPLSPITAEQYHSLKKAKGLEGLGNIVPMLPYARWGGVN